VHCYGLGLRPRVTSGVLTLPSLKSPVAVGGTPDHGLCERDFTTQVIEGPTFQTSRDNKSQTRLQRKTNWKYISNAG